MTLCLYIPVSVYTIFCNTDKEDAQCHNEWVNPYAIYLFITKKYALLLAACLYKPIQIQIFATTFFFFCKH